MRAAAKAEERQNSSLWNLLRNVCLPAEMDTKYDAVPKSAADLRKRMIIEGMDIIDASDKLSPTEDDVEAYVDSVYESAWSAAYAPAVAKAAEEARVAKEAAKQMREDRLRAKDEAAVAKERQKAEKQAAKKAAKQADDAAHKEEKLANSAEAILPQTILANTPPPSPGLFLSAVKAELRSPCYVVNTQATAKLSELASYLLSSRAADGDTYASAVLSVAGSALGIELLDALHKLMMHALQISGGAREVGSKAVLMMAVDGASPAGIPAAVLPESCNMKSIWIYHAAKAYSPATHQFLYVHPCASTFSQSYPGSTLREGEAFDGIFQTLFWEMILRYQSELDDLGSDEKPLEFGPSDHESASRQERNLPVQLREHIDYIAGAAANSIIGHGRKVDKMSAKVLRAVTTDNAAADIDGHGDSGPVGGGAARETASADAPVTIPH